MTEMYAKKSLGWGAALAVFGGAGIVFSLIFDWVSLARPWGFLLGLVLGISSGAGVALSIHGLLKRRLGGTD